MPRLPLTLWFAFLLACAPTLTAQEAQGAVAAKHHAVVVRTHAQALRHVGANATRYRLTTTTVRPASSTRTPAPTPRPATRRHLPLRR